MSMMTLRQAFGFIEPRIAAARMLGDGATAITRVHSDSRSLQQGDLFVALKGERFDANQFLPQAKAAGAVAALASGDIASADVPGIVVPDALKALGALATGWRQQFALPLIAVTGSNGKTTVTQMIAAILTAHAGAAALATRGNLNNEIGVPLTLLGLTAEHRIGVVELGMNHPGEIAVLAAMAQATVALVNNAQREHQEFMHTVEAVARENGAVLSALPDDGVAVFPNDEEYTSIWRSLAGQRTVLTFGDSATADVYCTQAQWQRGSWAIHICTPQGELQTQLHIAGRHNVRNALAATACALAAGVSLGAIATGLEAFAPVQGRSRALAVQHADRNITLVDDSYNANPDSVKAAIDVLAELPGPTLLVLGNMAEVGSQGAQFHAESGAYAKQKGIGALYVLGDLAQHAAAAFGEKARVFDAIEPLQAAVLADLSQVESVLVKGSRSMKMERVVQSILATDAGSNKTVKEGEHA